MRIIRVGLFMIVYSSSWGLWLTRRNCSCWASAFLTLRTEIALPILRNTPSTWRWRTCTSTGNTNQNWKDTTSILLGMGSSSEEEECPPPNSSSRLLLDEYMKDCLKQVDLLPVCSDEKTAGMTVTEENRKAMVRTLLGNGAWTNVEFKAKLQAFVTRRQWEQTEEFLSQYWNELQQVAQTLERRQEKLQDGGSPFQEGLTDYRRFKDRGGPPTKFFSFLARGREYQGKFERLLEDVDKPQWLEIYQEIAQKPDDRSLLRDFVNDQLPTMSSADGEDDRIPRLLLAAVEQEFPKASPQPADGGKASGIQSELNLISYLETTIQTNGTSSSSSSSEPQLRILAPVFLQNQRKGRNPNNSHKKKCPYTIELPRHIDLTGKTSELDAIVVELVSDTGVRIHQVWEAKATLHPMTIGDALLKKGQVLDYFVTKSQSSSQDIGGGDDYEHDNDSASTREEEAIASPDDAAILRIDGQPYTILLSPSSSSPQLGIFGKKLLSPAAGVRRMECVMAENLLGQDVTAVEEGLTTGTVRVPREQIQDQLNRLLSIGEKYQATMVVRSELKLLSR